MRNLLLKSILVSMLYTAGSIAFAGTNLVTTSCPPLNAFTHEAEGKPWALNEKYKNEGWYIFQTTEASESELTSLDPANFFDLRLTTFFTAQSDFADQSEVTCRYEPIGTRKNITLFVKSIYSYDPMSVSEKAEADRMHYLQIGDNTTACQKFDKDKNFDHLCEWQASVIK